MRRTRDAHCPLLSIILLSRPSWRGLCHLREHRDSSSSTVVVRSDYSEAAFVSVLAWYTLKLTCQSVCTCDFRRLVINNLYMEVLSIKQKFRTHHLLLLYIWRTMASSIGVSPNRYRNVNIVKQYCSALYIAHTKCNFGRRKTKL